MLMTTFTTFFDHFHNASNNTVLFIFVNSEYIQFLKLLLFNVNVVQTDAGNLDVGLGSVLGLELGFRVRVRVSFRA